MEKFERMKDLALKKLKLLIKEEADIEDESTITKLRTEIGKIASSIVPWLPEELLEIALEHPEFAEKDNYINAPFDYNFAVVKATQLIRANLVDFFSGYLGIMLNREIENRKKEKE